LRRRKWGRGRGLRVGPLSRWLWVRKGFEQPYKSCDFFVDLI
jgi:hypothetical protein